MSTSATPVIYAATSNAGKLRDFSAVALERGIELRPLPGIDALPPIEEDAITFEDNARRKAQQYSLALPGEIVIADDSGLEVEALADAPGVLSARYAAMEAGSTKTNSSDAENNSRLLRELDGIPGASRSARFVCVIAAARDGEIVQVSHGEARGEILRQPRGTGGFGYDPLFFYAPLGKSFAELTPAEKAQVSHRGVAFRDLLNRFTAGS
jgi:XTP/dITP diphosphohydrolase